MASMFVGLRFKIAKPTNIAVEILTDNEIGQLMKAIDAMTALGARDFAILWTFLDCGLRCSELTNLTVQNARIEEGWLKVQSKHGKPAGYVDASYAEPIAVN